MRLLGLFILITAATFSPAQAKQRSFMAYVRVMNFDVASRDGMNNCIIVADDGQYRFEVTNGIDRASRRNTKVYVGKVPAELFDEFKKLVSAPELARLGKQRAPANLVPAYRMEGVSLRIHRMGHTQELVVLSADGKTVIPEPMQAFVPWMRKMRSALGEPDKKLEPRECSGLDAASDFEPELQKR